MIDKFGGGPVGLDTLAAVTGEDAVTIEDVYEPYLRAAGLCDAHSPGPPGHPRRLRPFGQNAPCPRP